MNTNTTQPCHNDPATYSSALCSPAATESVMITNSCQRGIIDLLKVVTLCGEKLGCPSGSWDVVLDVRWVAIIYLYHMYTQETMERPSLCVGVRVRVCDRYDESQVMNISELSVSRCEVRWPATKLLVSLNHVCFGKCVKNHCFLPEPVTQSIYWLIS